MFNRQNIPLSRWQLVALVTIFLLSSALISGSRLSRLSNSKSITSEEPINLYLTDSIDLEQLSSILADSGSVASKEEVLWAGKLLGWRNFHKGHYQIDGDYSYEVLLSRMARGIQDPISLTILPGITEKRFSNTVVQKMKFDSLAFQNAITDTALLDELNIDKEDLLGRMLPNTYSIYWTASPEAVIRRMASEFNKIVFEPYKTRFNELDRSVNEIVALASIIEWEASNNEEKEKISGLYWNRLNRGMRLQADPTVNYAVNERRRLLYEDYRVDHPYNTYLYRGLPPGPITNPSLSSIEAALYPADHDYLYMVASPQGTHVFSKTFEEHKQESAKWREWLREQYRQKQATESEGEQNS